MRSILFIACLFSVTLYSSAQKKVDRQYFINLLNAGKYNKVFDSATKLRRQVYGKSAVVDYFIAKSLCLDGYKDKSSYCFNCIIKNHKLSDNAEKFINQEINSCNAPPAAEQTTLTRIDYSYINNVSLPDASVGGKMGRVYDCFSGNQTINLSNMVSTEELEARLFSINQKKEAVKKLRNILNDNYKIDTSGRYVFVTTKNFPLDRVNSTAARLEDAYHFFVNYYSLRAPDKLITVYILRDQPALREAAQLVHGILLPDANIGYSNLSDLSLLGLADGSHLGTLYHELFHLIVRTDVGDIPPFLDEGLASLYSVSKWEAGKLIGDYRPWRLDELREAKFSRKSSLKIPSLNKLLNDSWAGFDGQETKNVCQVAINYALSNFVMIYLQEKALLQQMVTAFKNRPFVLDDAIGTKSNVQIFEEVVKDSIKGFSLKFDSWFMDKYDFDLYGQTSSAVTTPVNLPDLFRNAHELLDETNEKVFKYKEPAAYKMLEDELKTIEDDYRKPSVNEANMNNAPANMIQQTAPVSAEETKRIVIQKRLEAYEKKLSKLIFDKLPKTAN